MADKGRLLDLQVTVVLLCSMSCRTLGSAVFYKKRRFPLIFIMQFFNTRMSSFVVCCIPMYKVNSSWWLTINSIWYLWSVSPCLWKKSNLIYRKNFMNIYVSYNLLSKWFHNSIIHRLRHFGASISFASCLFARRFFWHFLNYKLANNFFPLDFKANTTIKT